MARSKYKNKKTIVDNITFDSQAEATYYQQLKWLKQAKQIKDFKLQPRYIQVRDFGRDLLVECPGESVTDAVFDEYSFLYLRQPQRAERRARLTANVIVARPADQQVTLFELVGRDEDL